jgi:hypothetical protein
MVARAINVNPLDAMRQPPLELTLIDGTTSTIAINYDSCGAPSDAMRYLGIYIDIDNTWGNHYDRVRSRV